MTQDELRQRFPRMTPIKSPPTLFTFNTVGTRVYGARDLDRDTAAYVTTLCICVLFIPVITLRAYRVVRADHGWYFLGREPLSAFAKGWNYLVLLLLLAGGGAVAFTAYTATDAYKAQVKMSEARTLADQGKLAAAARIYQQLAYVGKDQSENAAGALKAVIDGPAASAALAEDAGVFTAAARVSTRAGCYNPSELLSRGMALIAARGKGEPKGAIALLDVLRPLAVDTRDIDAARQPLLEALVAAEPQNLDAAVQLADLLFEQNQADKAKAILLPLKDKLPDTEGARVLGTIYARDGDFENAYALLLPYVKPRLERLHAAAKHGESTEQRLWKEQIRLLNENKGPADFYAKIEKTTEEQRDTYVREYVNDRLKGNAELLAAEDALSREGRVVPVTLELGIVMLQRAQAQKDAGPRKEQLEAAQNVFLSIKSFAGESDEYRLFLGQVYYWLGKQIDGRKLFLELLTAKARAPKVLLNVATTLRELGADAEARELAEEAFSHAPDSEVRYGAAHLRYLLSKDTDDELEWLGKNDPSNPLTKANLALALGEKAARDSRDADAVSQFTIAAAAFEAMPRSVVALNQAALAYSMLFRLTGDPAHEARCLDRIQGAIDLDPSDPILLYNSATIVLEATTSDIVGRSLDLKKLHEPGRLSLLRYLYADEAGRAAIAKTVAAHPGIQRALTYLDKCMLVSPKHGRAYSTAYEIQSFLHNEAGLRTLAQRIAAAGIDAADDLREEQERLSGKDDDKTRASISASFKRAQERAEAGAGGVEGAIALARRADLLAGADFLIPADAAKVVSLAEAAYAAAPSSGTVRSLENAYLFRAAADCRKADPKFDAYYLKYIRVVGHYCLLAAVASGDGPFSKAVTTNADFQKALALMAREHAAFPDLVNGVDWALLRKAQPAAAESLVSTLKRVPRQLLDQQIDARLNPTSTQDALNLYWIYLALGYGTEAKNTLQPLIARGVPLPVTP